VTASAQAADPDLVAAVCSGDTRRLVTLAAASCTVTGSRATSLFLALGMAGQVVLDRGTDTACLVRRGATCHVRLGPDFLLERVRTADDLAYLLLHEVAHLVLGHVSVPAVTVAAGTRARAGAAGADTTAFVAKVENMAADMLVARFLHERLDETPGLDARVHGPGSSVFSALMATPETVLDRRWLFGDPLSPREVEAAWIDRYRHEDQPGLVRIVEPLAALYARVWSRARGMPLDDLTRQLAALLAPFAGSLAPPPLALKVVAGGDRWTPPWARPVPGLERSLPPGWARGLRDARKGEVSPPEAGGGHGGALDDVAIEADAAADRVAALTDWLRKALRGSPVMRQHWEPAARGPLRSLVPAAFGRTEALHLAAGLLPPLYPLPLAPACDEQPVRAYVDVSGSTHDLWSLLLRALSGVLSHRRVQAFQFSNAVAPLRPDSPTVRTTGGTDFDCVVRHALGHREVFVITDGYANLGAALRQRAGGTRVHVLLTGAPSGEVERHVRQQFEGLLARPPGCVWVPEKLLES
jgi:hypothetical protein